MQFKTLSDSNIALDKETHTYYLHSNKEVNFRSCTEFVGSFFEKFDSHGVATNLVANNKKYQHKTVEEVLAEWKAAADEGSEVHEQIERHILDDVHSPHIKAQHAVDWLQARMPRSRYDLHTEVMVYSEALGLAGTIDLLAYDRERNRYFLVDWKTNKRITYNSFQRKKGIRGPTQSLDDCHVVKYGLQLSLYQYILQTEYNIQVEKQALVHLTKKQAKAIPCYYAKNTIQAMLDFDRAL